MNTLSQTKNNQSKGERGQSLVELGMSLTLIVTLLTGAIDFSMGLFSHVSMRDAAQEGAVYGSIQPTDEAGMKYRVIAAASDVVSISEEDITVTYSSDAHKCEGLTDGAPNTLTITIARPYHINTPLVGTLIGSQTINLKTEVTNTILSPLCP